MYLLISHCNWEIKFTVKKIEPTHQSIEFYNICTFYIMCEYLSTCMPVNHMYAVRTGKERTLDFLELDLQIVMRHNLGAGN